MKTFPVHGVDEFNTLAQKPKPDGSPGSAIYISLERDMVPYMADHYVLLHELFATFEGRIHAENVRGITGWLAHAKKLHNHPLCSACPNEIEITHDLNGVGNIGAFSVARPHAYNKVDSFHAMVGAVCQTCAKKSDQEVCIAINHIMYGNGPLSLEEVTLET